MSTARARQIAIAAFVVCFVGFFSIHTYWPQLGVVGNAWRGEIYLLPDCPSNACPANLIKALIPIDDCVCTPKWCVWEPWWKCGLAIPYRWVLFGAVGIVAISFGLAQKKT
jgi:hypothetical protein